MPYPTGNCLRFISTYSLHIHASNMHGARTCPTACEQIAVLMSDCALQAKITPADEAVCRPARLTCVLTGRTCDRSYGVVLWEIITGEKPDKLRGLRQPECALASVLPSKRDSSLDASLFALFP